MPSGGFLFRRVGKLIDAPLVAAAEEVVGEEGGDASLGHLQPDQPRSKRDGVAIVVLAGKRSRERFCYLCTAAGAIAIGGNSDSDPRPANGNPAFGPAVCKRIGKNG